MKYLELDRSKIPSLVDDLNQLLANYHIYYQKLKNFHWNLKGRNFFELHQNFETLYNRAHEDIDQIAERIQILKYRPLSTLQKYLKTAQIKEHDNFLNDRQMVEKIIDDHKILLKNMRSVLRKAEAAGDEGTIDLISGILRYVEKQSWMLDSWIGVPVEMQIDAPSMS
jgi:starvation-inducible DNA-binding protein